MAKHQKTKLWRKKSFWELFNATVNKKSIVSERFQDTLPVAHKMHLHQFHLIKSHDKWDTQWIWKQSTSIRLHLILEYD